MPSTQQSLPKTPSLFIREKAKSSPIWSEFLGAVPLQGFRSGAHASRHRHLTPLLSGFSCSLSGNYWNVLVFLFNIYSGMLSFLAQSLYSWVRSNFKSHGFWFSVLHVPGLFLFGCTNFPNISPFGTNLPASRHPADQWGNSPFWIQPASSFLSLCNISILKVLTRALLLGCW